MATSAFTFNDKQRKTMVEVLKSIKTVLEKAEPEDWLDGYAWNGRASNYSDHDKAFSKLSGTTDTLLFFGDEPGYAKLDMSNARACADPRLTLSGTISWSMELNRQQKTFITTGKHFRIDDLFELKTKNESDRNSLIRNVIAPAFPKPLTGKQFTEKQFTGKQRIWLVTGCVPAYVLDRLTAIFRAFYMQQNPRASERAAYSNLKFVQIELETGYTNIDQKSAFIDSRWVLSCNAYIPRWPAYGPRYPKSLWQARKFSELFYTYAVTSRAFERTRISLVVSPCRWYVMSLCDPLSNCHLFAQLFAPKAAVTAPAGPKANNNQTQDAQLVTAGLANWQRAATGARVFSRAMRNQLPMQGSQASSSRPASLTTRTK
jgi:hypothetical protein